MYRSEAQPSSEVPIAQPPSPEARVVARYSAPGKVFLLGEYAVLADRPALVASVGPRFALDVWADQPWGDEDSRSALFLGERASSSANRAGFAPGSPASRLVDWAWARGMPRLRYVFHDPYRGAGGFGASSAQFALAYLAFAQVGDWDRRWDRVWRFYRELTAGDAPTPSGADLVSQWRGGVAYFDPSDLSSTLDVWPLFDWSGLLVFSASSQPGRKVPTHEHLKALSERGFPSREPELVAALGKPLELGTQALQQGDPEAFGRALDDYAGVLSGAGLECAATREDRLALRALPGVLGVKGSGALQADALVVLVRSGGANRQAVIAAAQARGLTLVSDGLQNQLGVRGELPVS